MNFERDRAAHSVVPDRKPRVFMMDLLAIVPYYTAYLSRALLAEGIAVTVGSISYYLDPGCFSTRQLRLEPGLLNIVGKYKLPRPARRILKLCESLVNMAALAVRFSFAPPAVIHVQYLPMLQWPLPLDAWFLSLCRLLGSKIVLTVHDLLPHDSNGADKQVFVKMYAFCDGLICHSAHIKRRLEDEFDVPHEKAWVIPHGPFFFDLPENIHEQTTTRDKLHIESDEMIVLWQGIIFPYKGVDILLRAWRDVEMHLPHAHLVIVGTGAPYLLDQIRTQVDTLALKRITLLFQFASTEELVAIYRAADLVVYPYREITTSGALATGLALNKAVVASDLPVFRELLTSGEDALLVPPNDAAALSAAIIRLLRDKELRGRLVSAVTRRNFGAESWMAIATQTRQVYESVLASG